MPTFFLIIIIYSLFVAFVSQAPPLEIGNALLSYYYIQYQFILNNLPIFILIFMVLSFLFIIFTVRKRQQFNRYLRFAQRLTAITILGTFTAFIFLFVIALVEMNALSLLTNVSPKVLGVETNSEVIVDRLKSTNTPPAIVVGSEEENLLPTITLAQSGKDTFFGSEIIPNTPGFLVLPIKKTGAGVSMVGNTLIVSRINSIDFQAISPVLSHVFIRDYFQRQNVKAYPNVSLMNKEEYLRYREEDYRKKMGVFDEVIVDIEERLGPQIDTIAELEDQVLENEQSLELAKEQRQTVYTGCVNEGYYEDDEYVRVNTREECRQQLSEMDEEINQIEQEGEELRSSLQEDQDRLEAHQAYIKYYNNQKLLTLEESDYISYEFASFEPPETIKVTLSSDNDLQDLADYLELLVHEYLHYTTYNEEGERLESSFFVEGLTEYFARKIIKKGLGVETNLGYPANVKIIEQINKRIADPDLADMYFSNDQQALEKTLDRVYGEGFYENNIVTLETLHHSSDITQILTLVNQIMEEIGGEPLTEKDLETTYSVFE